MNDSQYMELTAAQGETKWRTVSIWNWQQHKVKLNEGQSVYGTDSSTRWNWMKDSQYMELTTAQAVRRFRHIYCVVAVYCKHKWALWMSLWGSCICIQNPCFLNFLIVFASSLQLGSLPFACTLAAKLSVSRCPWATWCHCCGLKST